MKFVFLMAACAVLATACTDPAPECVQLCERVEKWTKACNAPILPIKACTARFTPRNDAERNRDAMACWKQLVYWERDLSAEIDCSKMPPLIMDR